MNINLEYNGKHYNFDIPKDAKIDYLKDLSCKLFKSDKTLLELMCNDQKIDGKNDNILIQDLIPQGKNSTVLTVQMGEDKKIDNSKNKKIINQEKKPKEIKIKKIEINKDKNNDDKSDKNTINLNTNKKLNINKKIDSNNNVNNNNIVQFYENRLFIANYIKKSNELFAMMKDFNDKVKETDNRLNRQMKNFDLDTDNNIFYYELSLFEKRLIDFQKNQIKYYKELIQILNISSDEKKIPNFDLLYNKILLNNYELNEEKVKKNKSKIFPFIEANSKSLKKINKLYETEALNTKLPLLKSTNKNKKDLMIRSEINTINNKEDDEILRTEKRKLSKLNNILLENFKNSKVKKLNFRADIHDSYSEDKEIKYQIEDINNKIKNNKNSNIKYSKIIKTRKDINSDNIFDK